MKLGLIAFVLAFAAAPIAAAQPVEGPIEGPVEGPVEGGIEGAEGGEAEELDPGDTLEEGDTGVTGIVVDGDADNAPLEGVEITIEQNGTALRRIGTLEDGRYQVRLPPGTYTFKFRLDFYAPLEVEGIQVRPGRIEYEDEIPMALDTSSLGDAAVINYRIDTNTEAAQTRIRQNSDVVQDAVSQEEISRSGDGSAGSAARRVVATQIVGGKYLFVRGLGGRYTSVTLNGAPIPQLDVNAPGVELDLLPSFMLSSLSVVKSYSPDLPGSFGGGAALLRTREFPEDFTASISVGTSINSATTWQRGAVATGSRTELLGFDRSSRRTVPSLLNDRQLRRADFLTPDGQGVDEEALLQAEQGFNDDWEINSQRIGWAPITSISGSIGDTVNLRGGRSLGYYVAAGWSLDRQRRVGTVGRYSITGLDTGTPVLSVRQRYDRESYEQTARVSAIATAALKLDEENTLTLTSLVNQIGEDFVGVDLGANNRFDESIPSLRGRTSWTARRLWFNQASGQHFIGDAELSYQAYVTPSLRDQPDTRDFEYGGIPFDSNDAPFGPGPWPAGLAFSNQLTDSSDGRRLFISLTGLDYGGSASVKYDVNQAGLYEFELGTAFQRSRVDYDFRSFVYSGRTDAPFAARAPELLFPNSSREENWSLSEGTRAADAFTYRADLFAVYAQTALQLHERFKVFGGIRLEGYRQELVPGTGQVNLTDLAQEEDFVDRYDLSYLPALSGTVKLTEQMNLRGGYSVTVARPRGPELSSSLRPDFINNQSIQGDPTVEIAQIQNLDLRWEWFPGGTDVIAASVFAKLFRDPIEYVILSPNREIAFQNVASAQNIGFELEAKVDLRRLHESLEGLRLGANFTYVASEAELREGDQTRVATSVNRSLQLQAPWVVNASLGYAPDDLPFSVFVFYLVNGPFITQAGSNGAPDAEQLPFHYLDLIMAWDVNDRWSLKASVKNLLNDVQEQVVRVGNQVEPVRSYRPGVNASLSVTYRVR
ncbi:MAG: TonB-dependent receptor [Myxococcota bacterium]